MLLNADTISHSESKGWKTPPNAVTLHDLESPVVFLPSATVTDSGGSRTSIRRVHTCRFNQPQTMYLKELLGQLSGKEDMDPIPYPGRSHRQQSHRACEPHCGACGSRTRSRNFLAHAPQLLKSRPRACAAHEKPPQWEACALQLEKKPTQHKDPAQP